MTEVLTCIATVTLAIMAIWGSQLISLFWGKRLLIELDQSFDVIEHIGGDEYRFRHLVVRNKHRWLPVKNVMVYLRRIEHIRMDDGNLQTYRTGPVPLLWQFANQAWDFTDDTDRLLNVKPYSPQRDVGPPRFCDLGHIIKNKGGFALDVAFKPADLRWTVNANEAIRVFIDAEGDEAVSNGLIITIEWDGKWHDRSDEMAKHLFIKSESVKRFTNAIWQSESPYICRCK